MDRWMVSLMVAVAFQTLEISRWVLRLVTANEIYCKIEIDL